MKKILLGNSDFKNIITDDGYFVDKSLLIEEIIESGQQVLLLPRPRRFGKTLNLSMLKYFFDKNEPDNHKLFEQLKIWKTSDDTKQHCGKYPVIFLSFKDVKANNWEMCYELLIAEIADIYEKYNFILESNHLSEDEHKVFKQIKSRTASNINYQRSLKQLSEYLYRYHNEKVIILIDEYDTPIQSGYDKYYDDVVSFMRNLLSGAFKDNSFLYKGIITGILRVSKESIFSGLNNISVHSVLDNRYSDKFGFTEAEIKSVLSDADMPDAFDGVKEWYNGYKFGDTENIYNPWSILNYVTRADEGFKPYWTQTSANELIKNEINKKDAEILRRDILTLINNQPVEKDIEENFVFPDLKTNKDLLWTLLLFSGYLTIEKQISFEKYNLKIPNYELKHVFTKTVLEWLQIDVKVRKSLLYDTAQHLLNNEIPEFEKGFKQIMGDTFSYYDTTKINEYVFHAYLLGLLAIIGDDYIIKSNRESGEGRYDIMLIPHDKSKNGVVIEIKQIEKRQENENGQQFKERINNTLQEALNQIDRNKYYKELIDNKIPEDRIIKLPIVFAGKEPFAT